jgi:hypothetical protein
MDTLRQSDLMEHHDSLEFLAKIIESLLQDVIDSFIVSVLDSSTAIKISIAGTKNYPKNEYISIINRSGSHYWVYPNKSKIFSINELISEIFVETELSFILHSILLTRIFCYKRFDQFEYNVCTTIKKFFYSSSIPKNEMIKENTKLPTHLISEIFDLCPNAGFAINKHFHSQATNISLYRNNANIIRHTYEVSKKYGLLGTSSFFERMCLSNKTNICLQLHEINFVLDRTYSASFRKCCLAGKLDVAKWLFSLTPNVSLCRILYDFRFTSVINNNHSEVIKWLLELLPQEKRFLFNNPIN